MDLLVVLLAAILQGPTPGPARGEVEVAAIGCVSGSTLTETNLTRNPSSGAENPARRWRLRLSKAQERALKEIGPNKVEVLGFANVMELENATLVKSQKVGPGRAYVGAGSSRTVAPDRPALPTLRVESFTRTQDKCR
jgi:hypothetical protein